MKAWLKLSALPLVSVLVCLSGCATQDEVVDIHGQVFYRERIALPSDAVLTVELKDVSKMDAPSVVIATLTQDGVVTPAQFKFVIGRDQFELGRTYAIGARITLEDKLLFINTQAYPIDVNSKEPMSVMLEKVAR